MSVRAIPIPSFNVSSAPWKAGDTAIFDRPSIAEQTLSVLHSLVQIVPDAMMIADRTGCIVATNQRLETLFAYGSSELLGQFVEQLVPAERRAAHTLECEAFFQNPALQPMGMRLDLFGRRKDGTLFPAEISAGPIETQGGLLAAVVVRDATERRRLAEQATKQRELLLRTIHHRVRNNLQTVSSLLALQGDMTTDPATLAVLRESQSRVRSIALFHQNLHQSLELGRIDFGVYIDALVEGLFASYGLRQDSYRLVSENPDLEISSDAALACGLILNEFVSSMITVTLPTIGSIVVRVQLDQSAREALLEVTDEGSGGSTLVTPHGAITPEPTLGLRIVRLLTEQLHGVLLLESAPKTRLSVRFPVGAST